jgi:chaperonin GroEL
MSLQIPKLETDRNIVQRKIKEASTTLYDVAKAAYGPGSSNVILGFRHGAPLFSHDGVTNLKMVRHEDQFIDDIIQAIKTVSEQNNQKVGDGTTAVVILAHHLLMAAQKMEGLGVAQREIVAKLNQAREVALAYIDSIKKPVTMAKDESNLEKVATVSAGDPEIGAMIADVMHAVGSDGGVVIESYEGLGVHPEIVNGFYFSKGYRDTALINDPTNNQSLHENVPILISSKKFSTNVDIGPILQKVHDAGIKEFVLIADITDEVGQTLLMNRGKGIIAVSVIEPPFVSGSRSLFLDDIALLVGAKVYEGNDFDPSVYLGFAKEVLITGSSTTILGGDGDEKAVKERIKVLRAQANEATHPQSIQFAKDRLARLSGKMAKIKVGGALEAERDELKLRVQDAVCAVQSAVKDGIVPGGGCTLARVSGTDFDEAFKQPFRTLMVNAGQNPDAYLAKLSPSETWTGFDLTNLTDDPQDMFDTGVIDAALVQKEVVRNATSIVVQLIMSGAQLAQPEKD